MNRDKNFILGIDAGFNVGGGFSISIFENGREIDSVEGHSNGSRSEDILQFLGDCLEKNKISRKSLGLIAISTGKGSLTGIRIGLAISKGLSDALSVRSVEVTRLEALAYQSKIESKIISATLLNKNEVVFEEFIRSANGRLESAGSLESIDSLRFINKIPDFETSDTQFVFTESFFEFIKLQTSAKDYFDTKSVLLVGEKWAKLIAEAGEQKACV